MNRRSSFGRMTSWMGAAVAVLSVSLLIGGVESASAKPSPPAQLCTSGSTMTNGTCTLYTPNGTYNAGGTVDYAYSATTQLTSFTLHVSGHIGDVWLCLGPADMSGYLADPANVCTPNGVLAKSPYRRVLPVSGSNPYLFAVPLGAHWFMHVVVGGNTLETAGPGSAEPPGAGSVLVTKTDANGAPLTGAGFTLYTDNGGQPGSATALGCTVTTAGNGKAVCSISNVPSGTYWVEETAVPSGYTGAAAQKVTVTAGSRVAVTFVDTAISTTPGGGTNPGGGPTSAGGTSSTTPKPIGGATTVHTGQPWAGSTPVALAGLMLGFGLVALGEWGQRRTRRRRSEI
jgi:hypothetical protein